MTGDTMIAPRVRRGRRFRWLVLALFFAAIGWPFVQFVRDRWLGPPADGIAWRTDLDAALREARATSRPVLVDVTAGWCPPCQEMARSTWPDRRVGRLVRDGFVAVKLDIDEARASATAQHYGVIDLPTLLILGPGGDVRDVGSYLDADEMLAFLRRPRATTAP